MEALCEELDIDAKIIVMDLASTFNCMKLYNRVKKEKY